MFGKEKEFDPQETEKKWNQTLEDKGPTPKPTISEEDLFRLCHDIVRLRSSNPTNIIDPELVNITLPFGSQRIGLTCYPTPINPNEITINSSENSIHYLTLRRHRSWL